MRRISDAVNEVFEGNPTLLLFLDRDLLNLTKCADFLQPLIAARCGKEVTSSALLMAISRYKQRRSAKKGGKRPKEFILRQVILQGSLLIFSIERTAKSVERLHALYRTLSEQRQYLTITEGSEEVTVVASKGNRELIQKQLSSYFTRKPLEVSGLSVTFAKDYLTTPGYLAEIFSTLALQKINIVETLSAGTELILYVNKEDVELAMQTLYRRFIR